MAEVAADLGPYERSSRPPPVHLRIVDPRDLRFRQLPAVHCVDAFKRDTLLSELRGAVRESHRVPCKIDDVGGPHGRHFVF